MAAHGTKAPQCDNSVVYYQNLHGGIMYKNPMKTILWMLKTDARKILLIHKALNVLLNLRVTPAEI